MLFLAGGGVALGRGFELDKLEALPDGRRGNEPGRGKDSNKLHELDRSSNITPSSSATISNRSDTGINVTTVSIESAAAIPSEKLGIGEC